MRTWYFTCSLELFKIQVWSMTWKPLCQNLKLEFWINTNIWGYLQTCTPCFNHFTWQCITSRQANGTASLEEVYLPCSCQALYRRWWIQDLWSVPLRQRPHACLLMPSRSDTTSITFSFTLNYSSMLLSLKRGNAKIWVEKNKMQTAQVEFLVFSMCQKVCPVSQHSLCLVTQ